MSISQTKMDIKRFKVSLAPKTMELLERAVLKGALAGGEDIADFENEMKALSGMNHALATSNGFSALHLALEALGIKNKKVLMPTISSCMAIWNAIKASGNEPVFMDSELLSPNLNADSDINIEDLGAIISPNYFGLLSDISALKKYGVPIIEDCAQSAASIFYGKIKTEADIQIYSFYPTKIINGIEGGMICSNDEQVIEKARNKRYYGGVKKDDGVQRYNYKMNNLNAVFAKAQLEDLQEICTRRVTIAKKYASVLHSDYYMPFKENEVLQKFILRFKYRKEREEKLSQLMESGIPSCTELNPMTKDGKLDAFPNAKNYWETHLSLPCYEALMDDEVEYICEMLNTLF